MNQNEAELADVGLEVVDLSDHLHYAKRPLRERDRLLAMDGLRRLASAFVEKPESMLQELVEAAVRLCHADSAGISVIRDDKTDKDYYRWIAVAGEYSGFLHASLPVYPSACTVCLQRGNPQLFRVTKRFFDILGVEAPTVHDGILLPWEAEGVRGTIFIISHCNAEAFDSEDLALMKILANFAAIAIRQQGLQQKLVAEARVASAVAMAHELAHEINNPLQGMTNLLFLAKEEEGIGDERSLALKLSPDFDRLKDVAKRLLELPKRSSENVVSV